MRKKLFWLALATLIVLTGLTLLRYGSALILDNILKSFNSVMADAFEQERRTPSVAEIEAFTRMKLPKGYQNLKAHFHVETRDGRAEVMQVKLSANRSEIKKALSDAGFYKSLEANPELRSIKNGDTSRPWWNPDGEKNVLSGYYLWDKPAVKYNSWSIAILVALPEKEPSTLYIHGLRF